MSRPDFLLDRASLFLFYAEKVFCAGRLYRMFFDCVGPHSQKSGVNPRGTVNVARIWVQACCSGWVVRQNERDASLPVCGHSPSWSRVNIHKHITLSKHRFRSLSDFINSLLSEPRAKIVVIHMERIDFSGRLCLTEGSQPFCVFLLTLASKYLSVPVGIALLGDYDGHSSK